jgi:hypothetical protein
MSQGEPVQPCEGPRGIVKKYAKESRYYGRAGKLSPVGRVFISRMKIKIIV